MDRVAIAFRIFEAAQRQHADPFAKHGAIGFVRERPAVTCWRQGRRF